jgi:flagellar basal-body rod modification protein FlgD
MSSINGTTPSSGSASSGSSSSTPANPSSTLNDQDFLQLLVSQLKYQDPMNPTDSDTFIQEQAQFSTVEGINNMESSLTSMTSSEQMSNADSLIGMNVEYTAADGSTASGTVSSASDSDGTVSVQVGSANVAPSSIVQVSFPSSDSTGANGTTGTTGSTGSTGSGTTGTGTGA